MLVRSITYLGIFTSSLSMACGHDFFSTITPQSSTPDTRNRYFRPSLASAHMQVNATPPSTPLAAVAVAAIQPSASTVKPPKNPAGTTQPK